MYTITDEELDVPQLPPGSRGVTMRVLGIDPPVALLEFDPGGTLGEDTHPAHDELGTVLRGSISSHVDPGHIPAGVRHTLRAGADGALLLVAMVKRTGLHPAAEPDTLAAIRQDFGAEIRRQGDRIDAIEERIRAIEANSSTKP